MSAVSRAAAANAARVPNPDDSKMSAISAMTRPSGNVIGRRWTRPVAMTSTTSIADSARSKRYSPACSSRPRPSRQAAIRNVSSSRTTPAAASRRPMARVASPASMSTNTSGAA